MTEPLQLAQRALMDYGLEGADVHILRHLGNLVCRVDTHNHSYALRVCTPDISRHRLTLEMDWSLALSRDTPLTLPLPQPTTAGDLFTSIEGDDSAPRLVALWSWLPGDPLSQHLNPALAAQLGEAAAHLHRHAQNWSHPLIEGMDRHDRYDLAWVNGPKSWWGSGQALRDLGKKRHIRLKPAINLLAAVMTAWGEDPTRFGLIHGDMHFGNVLVDGENNQPKNKLKIIDFDAFGQGYFLFDLAVTCLEFIDRKKDGAALMQAYLTRYKEANPDLVWDAREWRACLIAANLVFVMWVYTSNDAVRREKMRWIPGCLEQMRALGRGQNP